MDHANLTRPLQSMIDQMVLSDATIPGIIMEVDAPRINFKFSGASGVVDFESGAALSCQHPVRLASNTKTYVSAAILRLWEDGKLDLDASISTYLPDDHVQIMRSGGYDPDAITVRHLLTHTSGLFDYSDCEAFESLVAPGTYCWTRTEQLQGTVDWGKPYGAPGEVYRYTDTGYIELGEILERLTGKPSYGAAIRDLVGFDRLGLRQTWLEDFDPHPADTLPRAHQYLNGVSNYNHDASEDLHGGGGLVATMADLAAFHRAVFTGGVFKNPSTVETMLSTIVAQKGGPVAYGREQKPGEYRMGIFVFDIDGLTDYQHGGYFGTEAAYFPELDITIALTVNRTDSDAGAKLISQAIGVFRHL